MLNKNNKYFQKEATIVLFLMLSCFAIIVMVLLLNGFVSDIHDMSVCWAIDLKLFSNPETPKVIFVKENTKEEYELSYFENRISSDFEVSGFYPAIYNSYIYYNDMTDCQQLLYNIFEYAFLNCCDYLRFENVSCDMLNISRENIYDEIQDILWKFSCDTPMLEQNIHPYITINYNNSLDTISFVGIEYTDSENKTKRYESRFSEERLLRKLSAITVANQWVQELPEDATQSEKAIALFEKLALNCEYYTGDDYENSDPNYLYDALVNGRTYCDGFSNALSLLYKLAGIPCYEALTINHTWVRFELNGKWYNADASSYSGHIISNLSEDYELINKYEKECYLYFYFGFSDSDLKRKGHEIILSLPSFCDESYFDIPVLHLDSMYDENIVSVAEDLFDGKIIMLIFDEYPQEIEQRFEIAKKTRDEMNVGSKLAWLTILQKSTLFYCVYNAE